MEDTLGKRICANRKRLGLTQDAMAEKLGVTAQAVSKWENDQSCPDITMLPKLAQIFGITTDALLGVEVPLPAAEIVTVQEPEPEDGQWEVTWDSGRKTTFMLALWLFASGLLYLLVETRLLAAGFAITLWEIMWPMGLLVFGFFGLYPNFSLLRLGCAMAGGYYLLCHLHVIPFGYGSSLFLPLFLILLGAKLLTDAFQKPKHGTFRISHNGKIITGEDANYCRMDEEYFTCAGSFGDKRHSIQLPRLAGGQAKMTFGNMILDLTGCQELAPGACVDASCVFGELEILVPRQWRVIPNASTSFSAVDTQGCPDPEASAVLKLNCKVTYGRICIRYL